MRQALNGTADKIRRGAALPELLAPAGSYLSLMAAIEGGADAVYMGGVAFNARINAKNFTEEELTRGIALAHSYGVKVYIAANTSIYDRELDSFLRAAEFAYTAGADALIVADMGAAAEIRRRIPIELHASTQCSGHTAAHSHILERAGFSRMVCAREMKKEDIEHFIDTSALECEVFIHGALCVCHSGQCLFSSLVGGRSGNRGECAQPCRLPFKTPKGRADYPLSLKDLTLSEHIGELCDMGVASLKIEGRMKSPEYVRDVTRIWRGLLDCKRNASADEVRELADIFSRGGFTDAYFTQRIGSGMLGVRSEEQKKVSREIAPFEKITRKIPLDMLLSVREGEPMRLSVTRADTKKSATVLGAVPEAARTQPMNEQTAKKSLCRLGDTCYSLADFKADIDIGLIVPVSALNALRRAALAELEDYKPLVPPTEIKGYTVPAKKRENMRTAVFFNEKNIPEGAFGFFDIIYIPLENYTGRTEGVLLPEVIFDSQKEEVMQMLQRAKALGARHALVGNYGHAQMALDAGLCLHGDFRLNITNASAMAFAEGEGFADAILLPELTLAQARDVGGSSALCVYGRIPLMVTEKCIGKEISDCRTCESGTLTLCDRRGVTFPIMRTYGHRSLVFNSVPIYMADKEDELRRARITQRHFIFTTETKREVETVIDAYRRHLPPKEPAAVRRIK